MNVYIPTIQKENLVASNYEATVKHFCNTTPRSDGFGELHPYISSHGFSKLPLLIAAPDSTTGLLGFKIMTPEISPLMLIM